MSIFMLGLPIGIALSYAVSGTVTKNYGWRAAFFVAGLPGVLLSIAILFVGEPARGQSEKEGIAGQVRPGSPFRRILTSPTMILIIVSGAIHNFSLYSISAFVTPYLMRYHNADIQTANYITTAAFGLMGAPGLLLGGYIGDLAFKRHLNGRLLVPTIAIVLSIPLLFLGLSAPHGYVFTFALAMGSAFALMYFYYSCVYSSIHDIFEPGLRGTAMAVYFMAFYILGGSLGPYVTGLLSDFFTNRAARLAGIPEFTQAALEPFKAEGLHSAMYMIPLLSIVLALVLYAASRTVGREIEALQRWMNETASTSYDKIKF